MKFIKTKDGKKMEECIDNHQRAIRETSGNYLYIKGDASGQFVEVPKGKLWTADEVRRYHVDKIADILNQINSD